MFVQCSTVVLFGKKNINFEIQEVHIPLTFSVIIGELTLDTESGFSLAYLQVKDYCMVLERQTYGSYCAVDVISN